MVSRSPHVSVVLPVFNGARFVAEAIASIQKQGFTDWELIIVDDGSTDCSLQECRRQAGNDKRIRIHVNDRNLGLARTMNRLVMLSRGDYIAVQEQDDISAPKRLQLETAILDSHDRVGVVSGVADWIDEERRVIRKFPGLLAHGGQYPRSIEGMVRFLYTEGCKVVNAGCMFRRKIVENRAAPFCENARHAIDWRFFIEVAHDWLFHGLSDVVVFMRRGKGHDHLTKQKALVFDESRRCLKEIYQRYRKCPDSPINFGMYRTALANELTREGRYYCGLQGLGLFMAAIACDPGNCVSWQSLRQMAFRNLGRRMKPA